MLRKVTEYHPNPRQPDGRLWCGHHEADVAIDPNGVAVCRRCTEAAPPGLSSARRRER